MTFDNTYAVIMAGGVGSRFWPASRKNTPKQFLDLTGCGMTMAQATVERLQLDIPYDRILVVTGQATAAAAADALPMLPKENILVEPVGRNTAACVGWAALHVRRRNPKGVMVVLPSDHLVQDEPAFRDRLKVAVKAAAEDAIVLFGVKPRHPETGFGYVETASLLGDDVVDVVRFVEKPDLEKAKAYVESGRFLWNAGMFFFTAARILAEIERLLPELSKGLAVMDAAAGPGEVEATAAVYPTLPSISIDYGIMERTVGCKVVPVDFGWHDVGSWTAAHELADRDERGNFFLGEVISVESTGCYVRSNDPKKVIALVNLKDIVVVDTGDALLVCNRADAQSVKEVVASLERAGRKDLL